LGRAGGASSRIYCAARTRNGPSFWIRSWGEPSYLCRMNIPLKCVASGALEHFFVHDILNGATGLWDRVRKIEARFRLVGYTSTRVRRLEVQREMAIANLTIARFNANPELHGYEAAREAYNASCDVLRHAKRGWL